MASPFFKSAACASLGEHVEEAAGDPSSVTPERDYAGWMVTLLYRPHPNRSVELTPKPCPVEREGIV
ncbi:MAG: hypothetical protein JW932_04655 [Deltaproteobacteria bacterium]|nr:hypothetical protein [Deltaproteobacteria bacterium]